MNIRPALGAVAPPTELGVNTSNLCFVSAEGRFVSPRSGAFVSGKRWDSKSRGGTGRRWEAQPHGRRPSRREPAKPVHRVAGFRGRA